MAASASVLAAGRLRSARQHPEAGRQAAEPPVFPVPAGLAPVLTRALLGPPKLPKGAKEVGSLEPDPQPSQEPANSP